MGDFLSLSQCELAWVLIGPPIHQVGSRLQGGGGEGGAGESPGEAMGDQMGEEVPF